MLRAVLTALGMILVFGQSGFPQEKQKLSAKFKDAVSCNELAGPNKQVMGKAVGVEQCQIISEEIVYDIKGHKFRRVEIRLTGTVEGWASTEKGSRAIYFTDGPDFVFTQSGLTGPRSWHREIRSFDRPRHDDSLSRGPAPLEWKAVRDSSWRWFVWRNRHTRSTRPKR